MALESVVLPVNSAAENSYSLPEKKEREIKNYVFLIMYFF